MRFLFIVLVFLMGCTANENQSVDYKLAVPIRSSKDFLVPRAIKAEIEKKYIVFYREQNPKSISEDSKILEKIPREFLDVSVMFKGSAPGILQSHIVFKLPRGGGLIDLKDYVRGGKGSFYLNFEARKSNEPEKIVPLHAVYFVSETKVAKIDNENYGLGCKKFADVTDALHKTEKLGFQVNAKDQRYIPVLGGVFFFVHFDVIGKLYLSAIRIIDSRYPDKFCDADLG